MTIVYRDEKGANLTPDEVDGNFHDLDDRVQSIEDNPPAARGISEITQSGNSLFIEYTDSTQDGPFTLPDIPLTFRGEWTALTVYAQNDIITANGATYLVLVAHTSDTIFDPGAVAGSDGDIYGLLLAPPAASLPAGGGEGFVLTKVSSDDYDWEWIDKGLPAGGNTGEVLVKSSTDDYDTEWAAAPAAPVAEIATTSFAPSLSSANGFFVCTHTSGCLVSIPEHTSVAYPIGTELHFLQDTPSGSVILTGQDSDSTVTIDAPVGYEPLTALEGAVITAKKVSTTRWIVFGLVSAEEASDTA